MLSNLNREKTPREDLVFRVIDQLSLGERACDYVSCVDQGAS